METERQEQATVNKYDRPENKKSLISRFRKVRKSQNPSSQDKRDQTPSPPLMESYPTARTDAPVPLTAQSSESTSISPKARAKETQFRESQSKLKSNLPVRETVTLEQPPTAQEAAFGGPPRFDWIDIETAAAIKVQAAYRRNKVMSTMEGQGMTTSAIRNRNRGRKAQKQYETSDISNLFHCCGVGLAFGGNDYDAAEDYQATRDLQKKQYEDKRKVQHNHEAELRANFRKTQIAKKQAAGGTEEAYEIVE